MTQILRKGFFAFFVRPILLALFGLNVRHRERLVGDGPAVLVANHNSHLDALTLMCLFPIRKLHKIRPVAAQDYFYKNRVLKWFALEIIGIIPLNRQVTAKTRDPLGGISEALGQGQIVLVFPEGSRGEPEQLSQFKSGVAHIAKRHPDVPVVPIFMHGMGKALPKGEALLVPFFLDVYIGEPMRYGGNKAEFMEDLTCRMRALAAEGNFPVWQ